MKPLPGFSVLSPKEFSHEVDPVARAASDCSDLFSGQPATRLFQRVAIGGQARGAPSPEGNLGGPQSGDGEPRGNVEGKARIPAGDAAAGEGRAPGSSRGVPRTTMWRGVRYRPRPRPVWLALEGAPE